MCAAVERLKGCSVQVRDTSQADQQSSESQEIGLLNRLHPGQDRPPVALPAGLVDADQMDATFDTQAFAITLKSRPQGDSCSVSLHMCQGISGEQRCRMVRPGSRHSARGHRHSIHTVGYAVDYRYIDLPWSVSPSS